MKKLFLVFLLLTSFALGAGSVIDNSHANLSTTASQIAAHDSTRQFILIRNLDASIDVYVGKTGVTSATGMLIKAGESIVSGSTAAFYAVAASGTPAVAILVEKN